jgi:hypothetical protein
MQRRLNRLCEFGACATAHANFHKTVWIMLNVCFFTVNKFPLRNAFNFACTNQQFHSPISVCVVEVLTNVAFGKLLKHSHAKQNFITPYRCNILHWNGSPNNRWLSSWYSSVHLEGIYTKNLIRISLLALPLRLF